jgi:hypothetical protein
MTSIYSGNGFYNEGYEERCFPKTSWEWTERIITDIYNSPDLKQLVIDKYNLENFMKNIEQILPNEIINIIFNFICKEIKIKSESYENKIEIINTNDNKLLNSIHTEVMYHIFIKPLTQNDPFIYLYDNNNNYIYQYHINTNINNIYSNTNRSYNKTLRFYYKIHKRISSFQYAFHNFKLYSFSDDLQNFAILTYYKTIAVYKLYVFNTKSNNKKAHTIIIDNDLNYINLNIKWDNNNIMVSHYKNGLYFIQKYNSNTLELID